MLYNNSDNSRRLRDDLGNWVKNYSLDKYGKDWNYCLGLSYRYDMKNKNWRNNVKGLFNNLYDNDKNIDGFIINEFDNNFSNIHHHLIIKSDLVEKDFIKIIKRNWDKKGLSDLKIYNKNLDYCNYIFKHYNKLDENEFDMILDCR